VSAAESQNSSAGGASLPFGRRLSLFLGVGAASVGVDQLTKVIATQYLKGAPTSSYLGDVFRLTWATNEGAFLSLGSNLPDGARYLVLTVGVGLLLLSLAVHTLWGKEQAAAQVVGYAFIVSGGFSNWVDRARFNGSVVDFMNLGLGRLRTGIFNVADLAILLGIGVLLVHGWTHERRERRQAGTDTTKN
jgi:signal peptidase II